MDSQDGTAAPPEVETCRIVLWRGYRTSAFYACAVGDPNATSIGEPSLSFPRRRRTPLDTPAARRAHVELVSRLKDDGWVEAGQGGEWYETVLARLVPATGQTDEAVPLLEPMPEPEPEPEPEPPLLTPAPAVPSRPEFPVTSEAGLARWFDVTRPKRRVDRWRLAAATGLVAAVALLSWAATHPSAVGAAPAPSHSALTGNA
jgi:hypothetical protein